MGGKPSGMGMLFIGLKRWVKFARIKTRHTGERLYRIFVYGTNIRPKEILEILALRHLGN